MKSYRSYKTEINGLGAIEETIRVVEKSAASRIHFLKKRVRALAMYKNHTQMMLERLSHFYWDANHPLLKEGPSDKNSLLVITGSKGIVGGLYHELVNETVAQQNAYGDIWVIGRKGAEYLEEEGIHAENLFSENGQDEELSVQDIKKISLGIFNRFQEMNLQRIDILYPRFISLAQQQPTTIQFLPFDFAQGEPFQFASAKSAGTSTPLETHAGHEPQPKLRSMFLTGSIGGDGLPIFEPSKKFIFDTLLKKYIDVSFAQVVLEAKLSEFAARMVAAEGAVKETQEILDSLRRAYRKDMHRAITQKQLESFSVHQAL